VGGREGEAGATSDRFTIEAGNPPDVTNIRRPSPAKPGNIDFVNG
jgi:hypothetical protein